MAIDEEERVTLQSGQTQSQRGITLIELMTVMACLAILAALVVPNWIANAWPAHRLKNAVRQVVSDVRYARTRAVATNRQYRLRFDPVSDAYLMERGDASDGSHSWTVEGSARFFGSHGSTSFSGVSIVGDKEYTMVFRPTGGMTGLTISLKNTLGQTTKIICSMAGRIQLLKEA